MAALGVLIAIPFAGLPFWQASQTPNAFTLAGVVVREGTNQPLNHVLVTINSTQRREWRLSYITDADGRFIFPNLPAGKWDLSAEKNGYPLESYQASNEGFSTAIAVGPRFDTTHIVFPLHPAGILTGIVVDDQGDPVRQASVVLFRTGVREGKVSTWNAGQQQTDAAGEFSFASLQPGTYTIAVSARPWYAQNFYAPGFGGIGGQSFPYGFVHEGQPIPDAQPSSEPVQHGDRDLAYAITYYGDTTDAASAQPITVEEGNEAQAHITLRAVPAWRLTVREPGATEEPESPPPEAPTGRAPMRRAMSQLQRMRRLGINLSVAGPGGFPIRFPTQVTSDPGGNQQALGIPSGHYTLDFSGPGASFRQTIDISGDQVIDVAGKPPVSLSGRVTWEGAGQTGLDKPDIDNTFVYLSSEGQRMMNAGTTVSKDGSFDFQNNPPQPGRYRISLRRPGGFVVRSVQAKGAQYAKGWLELTGESPVQLSIIATSNLAKIDGIAIRDNAPCSAAIVLLLPADGNPDSIRRDQSDSDGTFTLPAVLPGRYTLVAIDKGRDLAYQDPAVMAKYLAQGEAISVPLKEGRVSITVQARVP
jgi:hypothetical protein